MGSVPVPLEFAGPVLHVLRHVDDHGARAAGARDFERGTHGGLELRRISDQEDVFGHRTHDGRHGRFLERIRSNGAGGHLPADDDDRNGVRHAIANRSHGVGGARSRGDDGDTHAAAGARVTRGHESRALLVRRHDERHLRLALLRAILVEAEHRVVGRQDGPTAVPEDRRYALVGQYLHDHLRAGHFLTRERMGNGGRGRLRRRAQVTDIR